MAPMLRRRCICFYCGSKSPHIKTSTLRQFKCEKCEAVNHLDENGDITDPPIPDSPLPVRYGQSIQHHVSPLYASTTDSLFCQTCLKNQHFLTESLASYLPLSTPSVDEERYERQYEDYRRGLEERYPQVCEECEPRVRARIKQTGYAAKADHLRRMMDRSRSWTKVSREWDWRYLAVHLAALAWWAAFMGQLVWSGMGSLSVRGDGLREEEEEGAVDIVQCFSRGIWLTDVPEDCSELARPLAVKAFLLGLVSIWWNPCLSTRWTRPGGKLVGLGEFYKLQVFLTLVKAAALYALANDSTVQMDPATAKIAHAIMLALMLVTLPVSLMAVKIDRRAVVSFQTSDEPLIKRAGKANTPLESSSASKRPQQQQQYTQPFPISSLAPAHARPEPPRPRHPLTPPPEDDENDNDGMDWTPSQPTTSAFNPPQAFRPTPVPAPTQAAPSPFYGRLPLAPISPAHALLNPPNRPVLRKNSPQEKKNFFNRMTNREGSPDSVASEATEVLEDNLSPHKAGMFEMSQQRFFPKLGEKLETGLESLFTGSFKIGEKSEEKRAERESVRDGKRQATSPTKAVWIRILQVLLIAAACLAWWAATTGLQIRKLLRLCALGSVAALAGRGLLTTIAPDQDFWRLSDLFIYGMELSLAVFLGNRVQGAPGQNDLGEGMIAGWLLGLVALQQVALLVQEGRRLALLPRKTEAGNGKGEERSRTREDSPVSIFSTSRLHSTDSSFSHPEAHNPPSHTGFSSSFSNTSRPRAQPQSQLQPAQSIRKPKTRKPARDSVGSTGFSGLSLGLGGGDSPQPMSSSALVRTEAPAPRFSTWGGGGERQEVVRRSGRIRDQAAPWGKGTI